MPVGYHGVAYSVIRTPGRHQVLPPIMLTFGAGGFSFSDYFTADEARSLAWQLTVVAGDVDGKAPE